MAQNLEDLIDDIKDLLKIGPENLIGIDIGLSSVRVAEMRESGSTYELISFAMVPLPEATLIEDEIQRMPELVEAVKVAIAKIRTTNKNVSLGIWGPNTIARRLQLAGGTADEIKDQVMWESEQYIPFNIDESALSYHIFGTNEGGGVDVLVAASKLDTVNRFKAVLSECKLKARVIDLSATALINLFEVVKSSEVADPNRTWILLDIGSQKTTMMVYRMRQLLFVKEINIAGSSITEELQRQAGLNYEDSENLKSQTDSIPDDVQEMIQGVLKKFYAEVRKTIDFISQTQTDLQFTDCVITGGSAQLVGVVQGLEDLLGIPVTIFDPFERIKYNKNIFTEELRSQIAFRGVVAMGLAMRTINR